MQDFDALVFIKDLNDIIELYHIKKHIDYGNRLLTWNENYINNLKSTVNTFPRIIVTYLRRLSNETLYDQYKLLDWGYIESFWEIISHYDILDLLDEAFLNNVLDEEENLRPILQQEKIVNRFATCLRNKMMCNNLSAHILLDQYVRKGLNETQKILVFGCLFGMVGEDWIIRLVNKDYETGCLESVLASMDHSKNAYFRNWSCHLNNNLALGNTTLYSQVLPSMGKGWSL